LFLTCAHIPSLLEHPERGFVGFSNTRKIIVIDRPIRVSLDEILVKFIRHIPLLCYAFASKAKTLPVFM